MTITSNGHLSTRFLNRLTILLSLLLLLYVSLFSWQSWREKKAEKLHEFENLLELEEKAIDSYFTKVEGDLLGLSQELADLKDQMPLSPEFSDAAFVLIRRFSKQHSGLLKVTLMREDGQILFNSTVPYSPALPSVASMPSWIRFREEPRQDRHMNIGRVTKSLISGELNLPLRYEVRNREGKTLFIVGSTLPVDFIQSFWKEAPFIGISLIGLVRDDGFLVSRYPLPAGLDESEIYGSPRNGSLLSFMRQKQYPDHGYVEGYCSSTDNINYLHVFKRLEHFPITLFVATPMQEIHAAYWKKIKIPYILSAILFAGGFFCYRLIFRQHQAWETLQRNFQEELNISKVFLDRVIEQSPVSMWISDDKGTLIRANQSLRDLFQLSDEEMIGQYNLLTDNLIEEQGFMPQIRELFEKGTTARFVINYNTSLLQNLKPAKTKHMILDVTMSAVQDSDDRVTNVIVQHQDITGLKTALTEKEILLKEVHHRVKNNLQIISSLLEMTRSRLTDQDISDTLAGACARIHSMSMIHSQLYQSTQFDRIRMQNYIEILADHLSQVYGRDKRIAITVNAQNAVLSLIQAMPCALVFNELISNSFKHAYQPGEIGNITITVDVSTDHAVSVSYQDDGIGMAEDVNIQKIKTLGMKLIHNLVTKQLKGDLKIVRNSGTAFFFDFKSEMKPVTFL